ncbi:MAG: hypothetical protein J5793_03460, partial [Clostridia bacterium]|nr:hypothetical protein [Clostridia bacterium]
RAVYLNKALKETGIASGMDELYVQIANSSTLLAKYAGCLFRYHDEEELLAKKKGEAIGIAESRKHMLWYCRGFFGAARAKNRLSHVTSVAVIRAIFQELLEENL